MSDWLQEDPAVIDRFFKRYKRGKKKKDVLLLDVGKLYKIKILQGPKKVKGTEMGYYAYVTNLANDRDYILFLHECLSERFKEAKAKKGDILAVLNTGKDMFRGYDYLVVPWKKQMERYIDRNLFAIE